MSQIKSTLEEAIDRGREIAEARSQLAQLAEQQRVPTIGESTDPWGSEAPDDASNDDVDELLCMLGEWHEEDLKVGGV